MVEKGQLRIAAELAAFIDDEALPGTGLDPASFWTGVSAIFDAFAPENRALMRARDEIQVSIDAWHDARRGQPVNPTEYQQFLRSIGYLVDEPAPFQVTPANVDDEVARLAGPQLVVPALNQRFVLNAANARWGSLYDALYGTDVLGLPPLGVNYDGVRGAKVIAYVKSILDRIVPLISGSHSEVCEYTIVDDVLHPALADLNCLAGWRGDGAHPSAILFRHNGLHIELVIDRRHRIGAADPAGIADVLLESALSTIIDLEDSIAAVDASDKVMAYANWLGLMRGDLEASFDKNGRTVNRTLNPDRFYHAPKGSRLMVPGRSLLFVRNVGHHMTTPAVVMQDGQEAPEGILDAIVTSLIALHNIKGNCCHRNSRSGSVYIVKPKMHGPQEAHFANRLFNGVEDLLNLPRYTIKIGLMDEERRTSANLAACINAVKERLVFINTGFLDRTGDEIHTSMRAGAMVRKEQMKNEAWIKAYEDRNVRIGLRCGLSGRAQIGKGMWAAPDRMADMLDKKICHPRDGANTAWVPSPTAAILHALHYHEVDVFTRHREIALDDVPPLSALLTIPLAQGCNWSETEITQELENSCQGILGYVVRWVDQGVGCSKVPDIHDINLMEDRATLRISSQHLANWLMHGVCDAAQIDAALRRMASKVDSQNSNDPFYQPMSGREEQSLAFQAARALIFEGAVQSNGYTELVLHKFRTEKKLRAPPKH